MQAFMPKGPMIAQTHCLITCATAQHQKKWSRVCLHRCRQAKRRQQSADMCKQTSLSAHVCRQCAGKLVCLHMCADNVRTNYFFCTCVQTKPDKLQTKPDKLQTMPDKLQTNCRQCQTNCWQTSLSGFVCSLSAHMCRHTNLSTDCLHIYADKPVCLHIVCTHVQTNQFVSTLSAHLCRQTSLSAIDSGTHSVAAIIVLHLRPRQKSSEFSLQKKNTFWRLYMYSII